MGSCCRAGQPGQPQPQTWQQQLPQPQPFKSQIAISPDLTINQNDKSLRVNGGSVDVFGQKIALPALPWALPANPALNSLQAIYPGESRRTSYRACLPH